MDVTHAIHRNKVFLITYTEYVFRKLLNHSNYSMQEIAYIVEGYCSFKELNKFFDEFTIAFADWCVNQKWDKTSASFGIGNNGENIAKSTSGLLEDFKQHIGTKSLLTNKQNVQECDASKADSKPSADNQTSQIADKDWREGSVHELKTWPEYYEKVASGEKTFEVRKLDRFFNVGDTLILKEWSPVRWQESGGYSGQQCERRVTYVMNGGKWDIPEGICIMGLSKATKENPRLWRDQLKESWRSFESHEDAIYFIEQYFTSTNGYDKLLQEHYELADELSRLKEENERLRGGYYKLWKKTSPPPNESPDK